MRKSSRANHRDCSMQPHWCCAAGVVRPRARDGQIESVVGLISSAISRSLIDAKHSEEEMMRVTNSTLDYVILTLAVLVMATAFAMAPGLTSADLLADHIGYMLRDYRFVMGIGHGCIERAAGCLGCSPI